MAKHAILGLFQDAESAANAGDELKSAGLPTLSMTF